MQSLVLFRGLQISGYPQQPLQRAGQSGLGAVGECVVGNIVRALPRRSVSSPLRYIELLAKLLRAGLS